MQTCEQEVSWHVGTHFCHACTALAECIPQPHSTFSLCDCTRSEFFLRNGEDGRCVASAYTFVVVGFWASVAVWSAAVGVRMWGSLATPEIKSVLPPMPQKHHSSGHFQRCKWANLVSILCLSVWCCASVVEVLTLSVVETTMFVRMEFAAHAILMFAFFFTVVELALTMMIVIMYSNHLRSVNMSTPVKQLCLGALLAAVMLATVIVPQHFHLLFLSSLSFALMVSALAMAFNSILRKLQMQHSTSAAALSAMQQISASYKKLALWLTWCVVASVSSMVVEFVAHFAPYQAGLCVGRFFTAAVTHLSIAAFQFVVLRIAMHINVKRRHSLEESQAMSLRSLSGETVRSRASPSATPPHQHTNPRSTPPEPTHNFCNPGEQAPPEPRRKTRLGEGGYW